MTPELIVSFVGLIAIPLAGYAVARMNKDRDDARVALTERIKMNDAAHAVLHQEADDLRKYCERLNTALANFQLDTSQRYVTLAATRDLEQRWMQAFERIEDKLDRALLYQREHK